MKRRISVLAFAVALLAAVYARAAGGGDDEEVRRFSTPAAPAENQVVILRGSDGATWRRPLSDPKPGERGFDPAGLGQPEGFTPYTE